MKGAKILETGDRASNLLFVHGTIFYRVRIIKAGKFAGNSFIQGERNFKFLVVGNYFIQGERLFKFLVAGNLFIQGERLFEFPTPGYAN